MNESPNFSRFLNIHGLKAKRFNDNQRVLIDKIIYLLEETSYSRYLVRFCIFFLLHCGEDFFLRDIARICRYTDRQLQNIKDQDEKSFVNSLWGIHKAGRHRKVAPELVGKIASFLVERPTSTREEILQFLKEEHKIDISCRTIDRLLNTFGLRDLQDQERRPKTVSLGHTRYGGGWLLLPFILELIPKVKSCFACARQKVELVLTLLFSTLVGIPRPFHLVDCNDVGFFLLTTRTKILSRTQIWKTLKRISKETIHTFYHHTQPMEETKSLFLSIDEHTIPRWTKDYRMHSTKVATKGRAMKADKLFYIFELAKEKLLALKARSANIRLSKVIVSMIKELRERYPAQRLRLVMDAGGCKGFPLAKLSKMKGIIFLVRGIRWPNLIEDWKKIPLSCYEEVTDPQDQGETQNQKKIKLLSTKTKIRGCKRPLRTILIYNPHEVKEKDRFYPIYTNDLESLPIELVAEYRKRQNHELVYRVMKHDLSLDVLPKSYQPGQKRNKVRFCGKSLFFVAWLKGIAFNILTSFRKMLDTPYRRMRAGTIIRKFILRSASLYLTTEELIVRFDYFKEQDALLDYCRKINQERLSVPWLGNRTIRFEFQRESEIEELVRKRKLILSAI